MPLLLSSRCSSCFGIKRYRHCHHRHRRHTAASYNSWAFIPVIFALPQTLKASRCTSRTLLLLLLLLLHPAIAAGVQTRLSLSCLSRWQLNLLDGALFCR
jgi:hypothetical protein